MSQIYFKQNGEVISTVNQNKTKIDFASKFQMGGQVQDPIAQVIQGLIQNPQQTIQALSQSKEANAIIQEIVKRAKAGDQQAAQAVQVLQQAIQGQNQQQQPQVAEKGAKLTYIKSLRGICPEGQELTYMKKGGVMCPVCKDKEGGKTPKAEKKEFFGKDKKVKKDQKGDAIAGIDRKKDEKNSMATYQFPDSTSRSLMVHEKFNQPVYVNTTPKDTTFFGVGNAGFMQTDLNDSIQQKLKPLFREALKWPVTTVNKLDVKDELFFKAGGKMDKKEKFFKKEPKAPLAKCGCKAKTKKK